MIPDWLTFTDHEDGTATLSGTPGSEDVGEHEVTIVISDGEANTQQVFTITVAATGSNNAPLFTTVPVLNAAEDSPYQYDIAALDPDEGDALTIIAGPAGLPAWLELVDNGDGTATLSGTPTNAEVGPHNVTLIVSDGEANTPQSFTITVANINGAPSFTSIPVTEATEDQPYLYEITATDPDVGDVLAITGSATEPPRLAARPVRMMSASTKSRSSSATAK